MVWDKLENFAVYRELKPEIKEGLEILYNADISNLADGHYEVNEKLFYNVQTYYTKETNDTPETHKDYIDIQYIVSGKEKIGIGNIKDMIETVEAKPESDIWFHHGELSYFTLREGQFVILFPQDAHAPCIAADKPEKVHKIVMKVRV